MNVMKTAGSGFYTADACDLTEFAALTASTVSPADIPNAADVLSNVPVYDMGKLGTALENSDKRSTLMAEWARILKDGAGVFVLQNAYADTSAIDEATLVYEAIIAREKAESGDKADHFAGKGHNDRLWNSLQKLCEEAPETFVRYFANQALDAASEAWLGPNYQMTAQVNVVHPGGQAQRPHRDYHLGFQTAELSGKYPVHVHDLSPLMTLQGGIAHCDMPVESGTTKLLPFSQAYGPGYAAYRREDFRAHFEAHCVQLPLKKGDAMFFNPALFHAAGDNRSTNVHRMVNLLQVSSAFGRALESVDRLGMSKRVFPLLKSAWKTGTMTEAEIDATIASTAEGYPFPTNLDTDPPIGGLAPKSQAALLKEAVEADMDDAAFAQVLEEQRERQS